MVGFKWDEDCQLFPQQGSCAVNSWLITGDAEGLAFSTAPFTRRRLTCWIPAYQTVKGMGALPEKDGNPRLIIRRKPEATNI